MATFVRAIKAHQAVDDKQISLQAGDIIQVIQPGNQHWGIGCVVESGGQRMPASQGKFYPKAATQPCGPPGQPKGATNSLEEKEAIPMGSISQGPPQPQASALSAHPYMTMDINSPVKNKKVSTRSWQAPAFSPCECAVTAFWGIMTLPCFCFNCLVVKDYERGVKLRHGRQVHAGTIEGGMHYLIPNVDTVLKIDIREKIMNIPKQDVVTKEGLGIVVNGVVRYKVFDASAAILDVADVVRSIKLIAITKLREILALHTYAEIQLERLTLAARLKRILDDASDPWGVDVLSVELTDLELPAALQSAMNAEQEAKRTATANLVAANSRREIQLVDAHGRKEASIVQQQGIAKSKVIEAEAMARSKKIEAEADMKAAENFAKAAEIMGEEPLSIQLRYLRTLSQVASGPSKTTMVPFNSSSQASMMAPLMAQGN